MEYRIEEVDDSMFMIEKHMESNGFFRNVSGSSKIGEIRLGDFTIGGDFLDLFDEDGGYDVYYMGFGCISGFGLASYRGEAPQISIGDKEHNIPVEDRIKFLYETLVSNENYNCLVIIYECADRDLLNRDFYEIDKYMMFDDDITTFSINTL